MNKRNIRKFTRMKRVKKYCDDHVEVPPNAQSLPKPPRSAP